MYFDSFGIEYIPQEVLSRITHNIFRIQDDDSIMSGFYCIIFIEYMHAGKMLLDYTNLFSPNDYEKIKSISSPDFRLKKHMKEKIYFRRNET